MGIFWTCSVVTLSSICHSHGLDVVFSVCIFSEIFLIDAQNNNVPPCCYRREQLPVAAYNLPPVIWNFN